MKIVFAGTPDFARVALESLLQAGVQVVLVLTQPDRPAGRGLRLQPSPVKACALEHGIPVAQPRSLRLDGKCPEDAAQARVALQVADADAMVVAAYGLILPQWVLDAMAAAPTTTGRRKLGCLNIHASLLPRWRGAAPIHRAIEAGDAETGVTIMQMDAGLDTGDMLLAQALPIAAQDTTASLHDKLAVLGAQLVVTALERAAGTGLPARRQPESGVSYARKIDKAEAAIDWSRPAVAIERQIRAFNPAPGAFTLLRGEPLKVWGAGLPSATDAVQGIDPVADSGEPGGVCGQVLAVRAEHVVVRCGDGVLHLTQLQRAGGKRLAVADFVRGTDLQPGELLGR